MVRYKNLIQDNHFHQKIIFLILLINKNNLLKMDLRKKNHLKKYKLYLRLKRFFIKKYKKKYNKMIQ